MPETIERLQERVVDVEKHMIENDARLQAVGDHVRAVESKVDTMSAKIDTLVARDDKPFWQKINPGTAIALIVALLMGGGGFVTSISRGETPAEATEAAVESVQHGEALINLLLKYLPPPGATPGPVLGQP